MKKLEKYLKGNLIRKTDELISQKKQLVSECQRLRNDYNTKSTEIQPQIDKLQEKANQLAAKFRKLYAESQKAYQENEKSLAKGLSIEGKAIQSKCESLNNESNALRDILKDLLDNINKTTKNISNLQNQINENKRIISLSRQIKVDNFGSTELFSNKYIEEILDLFPDTILNHIHKITYNDRFIGNFTETKLGQSHYNTVTKKYEISIFQNPFWRLMTPNEINYNLISTIAHEIGHVLFRATLTEVLRWQWGELYIVNMKKNKFINGIDLGSREEEFCECFILYKLDPKQLKKFDLQLYLFIHIIHKGLE